MHALRRVHRSLVAGASVIDLHPVLPDQLVEAGGAPLGRIDEHSFFSVVTAAESTLGRLLQEGLFEFEAELEFDYLERFERRRDLLDHLDERDDCLVPQALRRRIQRAQPPLDLRAHAVIRRFRAV